MKRLILCLCIALSALSLTACNRDKSPTSPPTPTSKQPDAISPAPVRPGDSTSPAVPGPGSQPPMPDVNKK
jgi:hypothetical protein